FAVAVKWLLGTHCLKTNGPVPTGWEVPPLLAASMVGAHIYAGCPPTPPERYRGNETQGDFRFNVTESGPDCVTESTIGFRISVPRRRDACCALKLVSSAAPSHGVPSWNTTFGRTVIVQAVLSAFGVTNSAR